jgi:hypothetical protein
VKLPAALGAELLGVVLVVLGVVHPHNLGGVVVSVAAVRALVCAAGCLL